MIYKKIPLKWMIWGYPYLWKPSYYLQTINSGQDMSIACLGIQAMYQVVWHPVDLVFTLHLPGLRFHEFHHRHNSCRSMTIMTMTPQHRLKNIKSKNAYLGKQLAAYQRNVTVKVHKKKTGATHLARCALEKCNR